MQSYVVYTLLCNSISCVYGSQRKKEENTKNLLLTPDLTIINVEMIYTL